MKRTFAFLSNATSDVRKRKSRRGEIGNAVSVRA
jgi:hypothetical protein